MSEEEEPQSWNWPRAFADAVENIGCLVALLAILFLVGRCAGLIK